MLPPDEPAGSLQDVENFDPEIKLALIDELAKAPENLRKAVRGLTDQQLDTKYKNWTIRQITHHVADSHTHSYIRFKWTLNEDTPTIKAYDEAVWVTAPDCVAGDVNAPLAMLEGIHAKWDQTLRTMSDADFEKTFLHPETKEHVRLWSALNYYPWHARHHTGQILWLRDLMVGSQTQGKR